MSNEVLDCIRDRRSHRKYEDRQLSEEQLQAIISAALQSPSGMNRQPWHFTVVQDPALIRRIGDAARRGGLKLPESERSPRFQDPAFNVLYNAPTAIVLSADSANAYADMDCGIAAQTIALAAQSLGLGSCIIALARLAFGGEDKAALEEALRFPQGHGFKVAVALGYAADDKEAHLVGPDKVSYLRG